MENLDSLELLYKEELNLGLEYHTVTDIKINRNKNVSIYVQDKVLTYPKLKNYCKVNRKLISQWVSEIKSKISVACLTGSRNNNYVLLVPDAKDTVDLYNAISMITNDSVEFIITNDLGIMEYWDNPAYGYRFFICNKTQAIDCDLFVNHPDVISWEDIVNLYKEGSLDMLYSNPPKKVLNALKRYL